MHKDAEPTQDTAPIVHDASLHDRNLVIRYVAHTSLVRQSTTSEGNGRTPECALVGA
jgi:hypothetical protein